MRTPQEIEQKSVGLARRLAAMCTHDGDFPASKMHSAKYAQCPCWQTWHDETRAFEACIPKKFWNVSRDHVNHNVEIFDEVIVPYTTTESLTLALRQGAGLFLVGANGCGKTMFLCYILMELIRNRNVSVYYTTTLELDELIKRGFNDKDVKENLRQLMLRHFVVVDEIGKSQFKTGDSFDRREIEKYLRKREQESFPTLLASNKSLADLSASYDDGGYGPTFASLIAGSYQTVQMEAGDYRKTVGRELQERMLT